MHLPAVISALFLLFLSILAHRVSDDTFYLLAVTSQAVGGTTETLCVTVRSSVIVSLEVTLDFNQKNTALWKEESISQEYHKCIPFQVPVVSEESVALINLLIKASDKVQKKATKILISPSTKLTIIETDKPIYKPGQTVSNNRAAGPELIGQWLNVSTRSGLVDLSYLISSEATNGFYTITVWNEKSEQIIKTFEVKDYVLPAFDVTVQLPFIITILDESLTLKVCAEYTYGKPVSGTVKVAVCRRFMRWYIRQPSPGEVNGICKNYTFQTDRTGCGQVVLNLNEYAIHESGYENIINVQCEVEEYATGVIMKGSGTSYITTAIVSLSFEDSPTTFQLGMTYVGKIKVTDPNSIPLKRKAVYLTVSSGNNINLVRNLVTNDDGIAEFSLDTAAWGLESVSLVARYEKTKQPVIYEKNKLISYYPEVSLWLQPYSKGQSFIELKSSSAPWSCDKSVTVEAQYVIHDESLRPRRFPTQKKTITFSYMVMSRGHLVQHRHLVVVPLIAGQGEFRGSVSLSLQNVDKLSPVAQVLVYTLLSSGEVVADSMNFPVQPCLTNKVSLNFTSPSELPGDQTSLILKAAPGSLCSVKAIDKSLLLLQPDIELNIDTLFNMLPVQMLSGYPYNTYDEDSYPCRRNPKIERVERSISNFPYYGKDDVYSIFQYVGIKILTNADIRSTSVCPDVIMNLREEAMIKPSVLGKVSDLSVVSPITPVITVRKYFPETWIWDLVPVSQSGVTSLSKTVPDSITTWQANAFCTSPVGFGVAPKTELTAFQPFFVSLTMPSSVIRGEVFTLKATVFSYLQSCMMVNVTLADSKQFSAQKCKNCNYIRCLCADESWTVSWTITPLVLGQVKISVTAEAVKSSLRCGKSSVFVPQKGRIDTVIKTLLVQAEGTKQYKSYNELLCPSGGVVKKTVSLTLPEIIVKGSAVASVSVVGDLMGRALQNLASLLAMPYGCGEQNMLRFAPNIFILKYLESTNQLTPEIRSTAETYLISGYQRELTYKHTDGSYSAFGMSDASGNTWLTAFVMKSFGGAKRYIFIDQVFIDEAKTWLGQQQQANGCFASVGQLFHTDMKGGVNDEVTLSAYITAAMLELSYTVSDPVVNSAFTCLRNAYPQVNSTYAQALLFYTFTLVGDQGMRNTLMSLLNSKAIVSGGGRHWNRVNDGSVPDSLEVEMTSYVLLALMSGPPLAGFDLGYSTSIVNWLSHQQNAFGGFASTQDTVVALQALAKYSLATYSQAGAVNVVITSPSGLIKTFSITQSNRLLYQESQLQEVSGVYSVKAEGKGCVYVQFTLRYNIPPPPDQSSFSISASASGNCRVLRPSLEVTITVKYNGKRPRTNMVVIEVRPLSGFSADKTSVKLSSSNSNVGVVKRVDEIEGIIYIYLDGLIKGEEKQYTLTIMNDDDVKNIKPAVVKVYDYYETGDVAVTEYPSPCPVQ